MTSKIINPYNLDSQGSMYAEQNIPIRYRGAWLKAQANSITPRQAIKAKCQSCVGYEEVTDRVANCSTFSCPIWSYRPYQGSCK